MVPLLHAAGHDVVGLDNGYFADCILGAAPTEPPCLMVDVRDVTVDQLRGGFDAVIHLAALPDDPRGASAPDITYDVNHHASVRLALLAKEAGVGRFLFASTCAEYGAAGTDLTSEDADLHPRHVVRDQQGARRGRRRRARRCRLRTRISPKRNGFRILAAFQVRHRVERPGRARRPHRGWCG